MKINTLILLLLFFVFQATAQTGSIEISGEITNNKLDKIAINTLDDRPHITSIINKEGTFQLKGKIERGYYFLSYGRESAYVYLNPKDNMVISLDANQFDESLRFSGSGSERNNYLSQRTLQNAEVTKDVNSFYKVNEEDYLQNLKFKKDKAEQLLNSFNVEAFFVADEKKSLVNDYMLNIQNYERNYSYYIGEETEVSNAFFDVLKTVDFSDLTDYNKDPFYRYLINSHWSKKIDDADTYEEMNATYRDLKSSDLRVAMLMNFSSKISSSKSKAADYLKLIQKNTTSKNFIKYAEDTYSSLSKLKEGDVSPNFSYNDINGAMVHLSDFKGRIVYIDVWATWCAPCIKQIPYIEKLEKEFHNMPITFVSISVDKKEAFEKWKKMVRVKNLVGVQLFADKSFDSDFMDHYAVNSIPRFIIIGKDGNIVDPDAPNPSYDKTRTLLSDLLNEN